MQEGEGPSEGICDQVLLSYVGLLDKMPLFPQGDNGEEEEGGKAGGREGGSEEVDDEEDGGPFARGGGGGREGGREGGRVGRWVKDEQARKQG